MYLNKVVINFIVLEFTVRPSQGSSHRGFKKNTEAKSNKLVLFDIEGSFVRLSDAIYSTHHENPEASDNVLKAIAASHS